MSDFNNNQNNQDLSTILKVVSFCVPLVGLILWITKKDNEPIAAKSAGKFAIFGVIAIVVLYIIMAVVGFGAMAASGAAQ